jgi:uncharacterized DUF497 family protein
MYLLECNYKRRYNATMKFEWDESKNLENIAKHGLDFTDAPEVFNGPILERLDTRFDYGEERWIAFGLLRNVLCAAVVYTERSSNIIRIISFRKADKYEREAYYKVFAN